MTRPLPRIPCRAVLFDAMGTLFHPHPSVGAVYARVARRFGVDADPAALDHGFRAAWRELAPGRFGADPDRRTSDALEHDWWRGAVGRTFLHAGLEPPSRECLEAIFESFAHPDAWRVFPDVAPALAALRERGLCLGVVSNFDTRLTRICAGLGLANAFHFILPSSQAGSAKPAAAIFQRALRLAATPPHLAVMVGDSPEDDVAGAAAIGCRAILLDRQGRDQHVPAIRSLAELPSVLDA